jgi:hypothetical protein
LAERPDTSDLAYVLNSAAEIRLSERNINISKQYATQALAAATAVGRHNEGVLSEALIAQLGFNRSHMNDAAKLKRLLDQVTDKDRFSARARKIVFMAASNLGIMNPVNEPACN